jgi:hypothetical protein
MSGIRHLKGNEYARTLGQSWHNLAETTGAPTKIRRRA